MIMVMMVMTIMEMKKKKGDRDDDKEEHNDVKGKEDLWLVCRGRVGYGDHLLLIHHLLHHHHHMVTVLHVQHLPVQSALDWLRPRLELHPLLA